MQELQQLEWSSLNRVITEVKHKHLSWNIRMSQFGRLNDNIEVIRDLAYVHLQEPFVNIPEDTIREALKVVLSMHCSNLLPLF